MSQENVEIVRRIYEAFANRDFSFLREATAPDLEIDLSRNVFNPDVYGGHEGIERLVSVIADVWDEFRIEPEELIDAGDDVVAAVKISGKGKGSGVYTEMRLLGVWTVRDGKVVRLVGGFRDRAEALEAAGLSE